MLTSGRQDWGILRSTWQLLKREEQFAVTVFAGGMHTSTRHGETEGLLAEDGVDAVVRLHWLVDENPEAAQEAARALAAVAQALKQHPVDALMLVGDRYETVAAATAATLARVPLIHLHGGEITLGSFDDIFRNCLTKMSHLHFVSHVEHGRRVVALGEAPETVHVVGAPGLDNLHRSDLATRDELQNHLGIELRDPVVIVALQPATWGADPEIEAKQVMCAMDQVPATYVITLPNSDPGADGMRDTLTRAAHKPGRVAVAALGERRFWGLMRLARAMLGNSSSALIEAPILGLPAVNIGDRQRGRLRGTTVHDTPADAQAIAVALREALARPRGAPGSSPFGDGHAAPRMVDVLRKWRPPQPPIKMPWPPQAQDPPSPRTR